VYRLRSGGHSSFSRGGTEYLERTLNNITNENRGAARIFTFGVNMVESGALQVLQERFLRNLAARNGGRYFHIR
jgi:hypothetical protein